MRQDDSELRPASSVGCACRMAVAQLSLLFNKASTLGQQTAYQVKIIKPALQQQPMAGRVSCQGLAMSKSLSASCKPVQAHQGQPVRPWSPTVTEYYYLQGDMLAVSPFESHQDPSLFQPAASQYLPTRPGMACPHSRLQEVPGVGGIAGMVFGGGRYRCCCCCCNCFLAASIYFAAYTWAHRALCTLYTDSFTSPEVHRRQQRCCCYDCQCS